jgi:hypothetical protein
VKKKKGPGSRGPLRNLDSLLTGSGSYLPFFFGAAFFFAAFLVAFFIDRFSLESDSATASDHSCDSYIRSFTLKVKRKVHFACHSERLRRAKTSRRRIVYGELLPGGSRA